MSTQRQFFKRHPRVPSKNPQVLSKFFGKIGLTKYNWENAETLSLYPDQHALPLDELWVKSFGFGPFTSFFDPFFWDISGGEGYLLFEYCGIKGACYEIGIGQVRLDTSSRKLTEPTILLRGPGTETGRSFPISFPNAILLEGQEFFCLESVSLGGTFLWQKLNPSSKSTSSSSGVWAKETGALSKVAQIGPPLYDPVYFQHGSNFYLCGSDASYTQHCFTSPSMLGDYEYVGPLRGYIKSRKHGRNAGPFIFWKNNEILRPYQDCSKVYGEDFGLMSLKFERGELVPQSLIELKWEGFGGLFPEWLSEKRHHFSAVGAMSDSGYALIDGGTTLRLDSHAWVADDYQPPFG